MIHSHGPQALFVLRRVLGVCITRSLRGALTTCPESCAQQVFAAKEAQLKELQAALTAEQAARAAEAECVAWLQSKVDALTQENYEVRTRGSLQQPIIRESCEAGVCNRRDQQASASVDETPCVVEH